MTNSFLKRSAIHNLAIDSLNAQKGEGLAIPQRIREASDLVIGEKILVAKLDGDNWKNRVVSFVVDADDETVEARGSLAHFLDVDSLVCVISETCTTEDDERNHTAHKVPVVDYGIDPVAGERNVGVTRIEYGDYSRDVEISEISEIPERSYLPRYMLSSLVLGLVVNQTHGSCLHGSAEIPREVMEAAGLKRHRVVNVFNASSGGETETYSVPMDPGVVMTTGAMAKFAPIGAMVNVASFELTTDNSAPTIVQTSGNAVS